MFFYPQESRALKGNIGAETKDLLDGSDIDKEFARILGKTSNDLNNRLEDFRHGRLSGVTFAVMTNWEALKGAIDSLCYGSENIFVPLKKVDKGHKQHNKYYLKKYEFYKDKVRKVGGTCFPK